MHMPTSRRTAALLSAAALAVGLAGPVAAHETDTPHPEFIEERNYFQCDGTTKVFNANGSALGEVAGWSTEAPSQSVQSGAGCGTADPAFLRGTAADAVWEGTFTGNIQDILAELHFIAPASAQLGMGLQVVVTIDGVAHDEQVVEDLQIIPSSTGASFSVKFGINDIDIIDDPEGPGDVEHTYRILVDGQYADANNTAIVWGTTEVPAGLTFNADTTGLPAVRL